MMIEINTNIWDKWEESIHNYVVITTNGCLKKDGSCVMGRGIAKQAAILFPDLPKKLGNKIINSGNRVFLFPEYRLFTFPVKHNWWENASLLLIEESCKQLRDMLYLLPSNTIVYMPKPGCSSGKLHWKDVKPIVEKYLNNVIICDLR